MRIRGRVFSGLGHGSYFAGLRWVREQCKMKLGFIPYPGTLNLKVSGESLNIVRRLRARGGILLEPPTTEYCKASCVLARIDSVRVAIIFPNAEKFTKEVHPENVVEVLAPVNLKENLSIRDGDNVVLELEE